MDLNNFYKKEEKPNQTPLTDETFTNMMIQRDEWEDKRTNRKLNQGTFTNIWLFIIAMYCLFELIKEIIPIIAGITLIQKILEWF